nr:hypothetical protein [Candidatus Cloacimonadota bacterium]
MKKLLFLGMLILPILLSAISVTASTNLTTLSLTDRLEYSIKITAEERIDISEPAPPKIENFSFVNMNSSSRTSTTIQNFKSHTEHVRSYTYYYIPLRTGESIIPSQEIRIGNKTYKTQEIKLRIVDSGSSGSSQSAPPISPGFDFDDPNLPWSANRMTGNTTILAFPQRQEVYKGQPTIISYYLYTDQMVRSFNLEDERDFPGYGKSNYEQPNTLNYETVTHQGKRFQRALIKRLMLLPNDTGEMQVPTLRGTARIYELGYRNTIVSSEPAWLNVLPLPTDGMPESFSGAVGSFEISDNVSADQVSLGEAITYSIRIAGTGNFNQFSHPELPANNAQVSSPMVVDRLNAGIEGTRTLYYTIIPSEKGTYTLGPVTFNWFDPEQEKYCSFQSEPRQIEVKGANVLGYFSGLLDKDNPQTLRPMISRDTYPDHVNIIYTFWYWLLVVIILGATAFSGYLAWHKAKARNNPEDFARMMADKALKKYLAEASLAVKNLSEDFYSLAEKGLMKYLRDKYGFPNRYSTAEILEHLRDKDVPETTMQETKDFIEICERQRFSPDKKKSSEIMEDYQKLRHIVNLYSKKGKKR